MPQSSWSDRLTPDLPNLHELPFRLQRWHSSPLWPPAASLWGQSLDTKVEKFECLLGPHNLVTEMDMAIHMSAFGDLVKKYFSWICSTGRSHLIFYELLSLGWGVVHIDYMIQYLISRLYLSFYANQTCHVIDGIKIQIAVVCKTVNM